MEHPFLFFCDTRQKTRFLVQFVSEGKVFRGENTEKRNQSTRGFVPEKSRNLIFLVGAP